MTNRLTTEQVEEIVNWMNNWEQLKDTVIPLRFKEDWSKQLHTHINKLPLDLRPRWSEELASYSKPENKKS